MSTYLEVGLNERLSVLVMTKIRFSHRLLVHLIVIRKKFKIVIWAHIQLGDLVQNIGLTPGIVWLP